MSLRSIPARRRLIRVGRHINNQTMNPSTALRLFVVLELILVIGGVVSAALLEGNLPEPLRQWLVAEAEREPTPQETAVLAILIPVLISSVAGSIGLLLLKRWGAWIFLIALIAGSALMPFTGPTVAHPLADAIDELSLILSGLIIGLAFFTNALRSSARPTHAEQAEQGGGGQLANRPESK